MATTGPAACHHLGGLSAEAQAGRRNALEHDAKLDNNCNVNFADLGLFKAAFFTSDENADFDDSGSVNFADLGVVKSFFFRAPGPSGVPNGCAG